MKNKSKKFLLAIDAIIIFGSLISVFIIIGYTEPFVIAPLEENKSSLMFVIPSSDYILIDDNIDFTSFDTVFMDDVIALETGRYYIKTTSGLKSEINEIKTEVDVILQFRRLSDNSIGVFNIGQERLQLDKYNMGMIEASSLAYPGAEE